MSARGTAPTQTELEAALPAILADPARLRPHLQPIADLKRGAIAGYELLARFDHPLGASPFPWFEAAAAIGLRDDLELAVIAAARRMRDELPANTFLSVNLTSRGATSPAILEALGAGPRLERMVIEFTEQEDVDDIEMLARSASAFRNRGAMIAIDDAGAGYSGLQRILGVRPEFIKLDRALIAELDRDPARAATVEMLGSLAGRIDAWVIAEGVERHGELERLMQLSVPLAQGYLLGRPRAGFGEHDLGWVAAMAMATKHESEDRIGPLVETLRPALEEASPTEIGWRFDDDPGMDFLPLVDSGERPAGMIARGSAQPRGTLSILPTTSARDALARAMIRPREERLMPLVCCDETGRYLGLVGVERMIERVLADPAADAL